MAGRRSWQSPSPRYRAVPMPIQPAPGAAVLPRQFLHGKECAEDSLLAVEVELVGVGEVAGDPVAQIRPARWIGATGEIWHRLPFLPDQLRRAQTPARSASDHP